MLQAMILNHEAVSEFSVHRDGFIIVAWDGKIIEYKLHKYLENQIVILPKKHLFLVR